MKTYKYLFFDLDGTIIDPKEGITRSVEYALQSFGIEVENRNTLCSFIGPPLYDSFREYYGFSDEDARKAILKYHERFVEKGIHENILYEGIPELLDAARKAGKRLMVATSKPGIFAEQIIQNFNLHSYFDFIGGSDLDGSRPTKGAVIQYVLDQNQIHDLSSVLMIGDRKHDIIGARQTGIDSAGVLYGYGDYKELEEAGASYIIDNIAGLYPFILQKAEKHK